ncbi:MAG: hypothetical protein KGQ41_06950 [Alphaproteobacteria bacterium]|nr:hypothetical protein [Alphaproteobacteria bacterium]
MSTQAITTNQMTRRPRIWIMTSVPLTAHIMTADETLLRVDTFPLADAPQAVSV